MKKTRIPKSWSKHNLPAELWPDILSRLPVKSLLRFRCVSKSWRSLIDDPNFCCSHLKNFKNNSLETHLFVNQYGANQHKFVVRCSKTFVLSAEFDTLDSNSNRCSRTLSKESYWHVICSLDGLVLLKHGTPTPGLILWNPSIRRARVLHVSSTFTNHYADVGFGFDPIIKDYKVLRLVQSGENNLHSVKIYSVGIREWRTIEYHDIADGSKWRWTFQHNYFNWKGLCCRGALYFTAQATTSDAWELVVFNLSKEEFSSTSLPEDDDNPFGYLSTLALLDGGCTLGSVNVSRTNGNIWVLESCGADMSSLYWTKRYTFASKICPSEFSLRYFLYIKSGIMLLQWHRQVTSYDLESHEEKSLLKNGRKLEMSMVRCYMESLLLLNG